MTAFSIVLSVALMNLCRNRHLRPLPRFVRIALDGWLGRALLLHWMNAVPTAGPMKTLSQRAHEKREHNHPIIIASFEVEYAEDQTIGNEHLMDGSGHCTEADGGALSNVNVHYWYLLATAIDRMIFCVYAFVFVIMSSVYGV